MEQCLRDLQPFYQRHNYCRSAENDLDTTAPLCDSNQTKFEQDFCDYADKLHDTCTAQDDCRSTHIKVRNETHVDVKGNEEARKSDFKTGKLILCYFSVFESNN